MSFEPTPSQALLIFGLLARHGECQQAELMPAVKKADRESLVKAKLILAEKVGHELYLRLEDAGWGWAGSNLTTELPPAQRALSNMLGRLGAHLARSGETLADFIGAKPAPASFLKSKVPKKQAGKKVKTKGISPSRKPRPPTPAALRKRIELAYLKITGGRKDENLKLSRLRAALNDLDRATVDAALARILKGDKKASLARDDDMRRLAQSDHDAAFCPSGEPFHMIWISS